LDYPDLARFPNFKDLKGVEAIVNPGEILYIPMYWWHHVINVEDTVAINFWYKVCEKSLQFQHHIIIVHTTKPTLTF
jgi:mannose-6-phosphate isomerase-like protein (cupin superfamily)